MTLIVKQKKREKGVFRTADGALLVGDKPTGVVCECFESIEAHDAVHPEHARARSKAQALSVHKDTWTNHKYDEVYRLKREDAELILSTPEELRTAVYLSGQLHILDQEAELEGLTLTEIAEAVMANVGDRAQLVADELARRAEKKAWREMPD